MTDTAQELFDNDVTEMVRRVIEHSKPYGSVHMAVALGNQSVIGMLAIYELEVLPNANDVGIQTKSIDELFGFDITITAKNSQTKAQENE